jgi:hypothetical protein
MRKNKSTKRGARLVLDECELIEYPVGTGSNTIHRATSPHCDLHLVYADSREKSMTIQVRNMQNPASYEKHKRTCTALFLIGARVPTRSHAVDRTIVR